MEKKIVISPKNKLVYFLYYIVHPRAQLVAMLLFSGLLSALFVFVFYHVNIFDTRPIIQPLLPQELKSISTNTTQVEVGLHINNFPEFSIKNNYFVFDANLWFLFDPSVISLETISKFNFYRGRVIEMSEPDTKLIDGKFFAQYDIRVEFKADLNQKYFPFDDHRLYISLSNRYVTPEEVVFASSLSKYSISKGVLIIGWKPIDRAVESGFITSILDKFDSNKNISHPVIMFSINFMRVGIQDIFLIFLPLCLMMFISLFSFSLDPPEKTARMFTLALTGVTGLMGYRFVLQNLTPQVGYVILSDCFFLLFLAVIFLVFCTCLILVRRAHLTSGLIVFRGLVYLGCYALLIGCSFYFLFFWPYI